MLAKTHEHSAGENICDACQKVNMFPFIFIKLPPQVDPKLGMRKTQKGSFLLL